jgi:Sel1 repeat
MKTLFSLMLALIANAALATENAPKSHSIGPPPPLAAKVRDAGKEYPAVPSEVDLERVQHMSKQEVIGLSAAGRVGAQIQHARMAWWDGDRHLPLDLLDKPEVLRLPVAQYLLSTYLRFGNRDVPRSMSLLQQAAAAGHPVAQEALAGFFKHGRHGLEKDDARAFALYLRAGRQGLAHSQLNVAMMLCKGQGVETDKALGALWFDNSQAGQRIPFSRKAAGCE